MKKIILIILCLALNGCGKIDEEMYTDHIYSLNKDIEQLERTIETKDAERYLYETSFRIQNYYAKQGINKSVKLIYETVRQAFLISPIFPPPRGLTSETFAFYLITFASVETDFNPMVLGKNGDSGITQTLKKDYKRLTRKAKRRGLDFKDDPQNIRTGLICCAEEYSEKLVLSEGDLYEAIWRYNGDKNYAKRFYKRYDEMRYGE